MSGRPPIPTRTDTLLPYPTLFRSAGCHRFTRDELAIEPGRARCRHLIGKRQVRTSGERQTAIASRIIPRSQFDDRAWLRVAGHVQVIRSEEHTSELQSLMRNSYAVFCLNKKT